MKSMRQLIRTDRSQGDEPAEPAETEAETRAGSRGRRLVPALFTVGAVVFAVKRFRSGRSSDAAESSEPVEQAPDGASRRWSRARLAVVAGIIAALAVLKTRRGGE